MVNRTLNEGCPSLWSAAACRRFSFRQSRSATEVTLFEKSDIDCIGHGLVARIVGMEMVF
jgi:hypothetical protein